MTRVAQQSRFGEAEIRDPFPAVSLLLASSFVAAFLNVAVSLLIYPAEQGAVPNLLANVGATLLFFLGLHFVAWYLVQKPINHLLSLQRLPSLLALTLGTLTFALLYPIVDYALSNVPDLAAALGLLLALLVASIYVLSYQASVPRSNELASATGPRTLILGAPLVAGATLLFVWMMQTRIDIRDGSSGLPTIAALTALFSYLVVLVAIWALAKRLGPRLGPVTLVLTASAIVVAPVLGYFAQNGGGVDLASTATTRSATQHVILITVDTLRADTLGAYNPKSRLTPEIDALASDSVVFLNTRSAAPWTKPAMASILTGLSPLVHRALTPVTSIGAEIPTLAERLRDEGFATAAIGRNSNLSSVFKFDQGFQSYRMYLGSAVLTNPSVGSRVLESLGLGLAKPSTERLANSARQWLEANAAGPFFFWLHFFDPHAPFSPPADWLQAQGLSQSGLATFDEAGEVRGGSRVLSQAEKQRVKSLYDAEVRMVDDAVGRVLDTLRELGLYEDSLIIFTSDHGEEFFEHGSIAHGHTVYDEVLKVPLLVKLPGSTATEKLHMPVSTESVTPTIVDLVGAPFNADHFTSGSLARLWRGEARAEGSQVEAPIVSTGMLFYEERVALIFDQWKYVRFKDSGREELYDLGQDPGESLSIATSQPDVLEQARMLLNRHFEKIDDFVAQSGSLVEDASDEIPKAVVEDLKALGYLQ